jgi:hypothetical protein
MNRRTLLLVAAGLAACAVLLVIYSEQRPEQPVVRTPPPPPCGDPCGSERWAIKTLSDPDAGRVNLVPTPATIGWLRSQPRPPEVGEFLRVAPIEMQTFRVEALLVGFMREADRDIHMVLADPLDPSLTMVAEIPALSCTGVCNSVHAETLRQVREQFAGVYGEPTAVYREGLRRRVTVTGVAFFDYVHGQLGMAPNGIELHPVLEIHFGPP